MGSLIMSLETEESSVTRPLPRPLLGSSWSHHYRVSHYGVLLSLVSPHIIQVTSHPGHHLLLITIDYSSLSLLSTSLTPGWWQLTATCQWLTRPGHWPHNTASSHQRPSESVAILGCYEGSHWSSHQH